MIFTIITMIVVAIGVALLCKAEYDEEALFGLGVLFTLGGGIVASAMALCIIFAHVGVDVAIEKNRIEYESLCQRYEIVTSEYEDVSKSDVIKDIAEWNKNVYNYKHWANNPWTSWFYSKRIADSIEMIETERREE